ncbi:MAG: ABC transporter permease [Dietzia sp.]
MTLVDAEARPGARVAALRRNPLLRFLVIRAVHGAGTLLMVSMLVFWATQLLPGDAANAVLGRSATAESLAALKAQLGLDQPVLNQYWSWLTGVLTGSFGASLVTGEAVGGIVGDRVLNSGVLLLMAGSVGTVIGVLSGLVAAAKRDRAFDHVTSVTALVITALPEFVVGVALILLFATGVLHVLPAASPLSPGMAPWDDWRLLALPLLTLIVVIVPYVFRMVRAVAIETLESEYVQTARLKGLRHRDILLRHALPNIVPATVQAVGLSVLYLAGGVVVVEVVFNYPGVGQGLVQSVATRDIPVIQLLTLLLAAFYVLVNIATDLATLMATPKRRIAR